MLDADDHPRRIDRAASLALAYGDAWVTVPTRDEARTADRLVEYGLRTPPHPEWMMAVALADQRTSSPPTATPAALEAGPGLVAITVHDPDGQVAATGQMGVVGEVAVMDKIETQPAHRRRGLGGAMMSALAERSPIDGRRPRRADGLHRGPRALHQPRLDHAVPRGRRAAVGLARPSAVIS